MVEYATLYDIPEVVQIALDECLAPNYELFDEFSGIFVADYFGSEGVKQLLEEHGQTLDPQKIPIIVSAGNLDKQIEFLSREDISYPLGMAQNYGDLTTTATVIFNKAGQLILPKFIPKLPPAVTKHVR
jgi:hypothetical protein